MFIGEFVIARTRHSGVHCGVLHQQVETAAVLTDARRIWEWTGAFSLHEMSRKGCSQSSKISDPVPCILLTEVGEIIPCSEEARENLSRSRNNPSGRST